MPVRFYSGCCRKNSHNGLYYPYKVQLEVFVKKLATRSTMSPYAYSVTMICVTQQILWGLDYHNISGISSTEKGSRSEI